MRLLGLLITLAIIGYATYVYLGSSSINSSETEVVRSKPKEYIDHAKQTTDAMNRALQSQKDRLDNSLDN